MFRSEHFEPFTSASAAQVRRWVSTRPFVLESIRIGIANLAAVARMAAEDLPTIHPVAARAALKRYAPKIQPPYFPEQVRSALTTSRILTRTRVAIITVRQGTDVLRRLADPVRATLAAGLLCRVIQGTQGIVVNVDEDAVPLFTRHLGEPPLISTRRNLAELAVSGPPIVADTRGILALLAAVLSANGFNIAQATASYSDVIFLVPSSEVGAASQLLGSLIDDVTASPRRFRRVKRPRVGARFRRAPVG
ncbi:MAG TPA: ACT domain-containing protein [Thermoplasmata archaeon]|nr:ACT domain-containing protein [Thermoplasmata archaeon]